MRLHEENLLDLILGHDQAFESIFIDEETDDTFTLFFDPCEKYDEGLALQTMNLIAPIAIEGQINYEGEDGRMWCLHLDKDGFHRYKGQIRDNVLVYRGAGPEEPEGWYSENLMSLAQELRNDPNGQKELLSAYKDKTGQDFLPREIHL